MINYNNISIKKNDGSYEPFDAEKINEKVMYACEGLSGVSVSDVVMNTTIKITDKCKSKDIQKALIQSAAELISEETPNYDIVAARLLNQMLRKEVYGQYSPKDFLTCVKDRVKKGYYDKSILEDYTEDEISYYGSKIKYQLDEQATYSSISQMYSKYLLKNKSLTKVIETPQEVFMVMNMYIFAKEQDRKKWILEGYKALSNKEVSFPTPIMNGLRSNYKTFISCNVLDVGDSTKSLAEANGMILKMTAAKSGIGLNGSHIRGLDADIEGKPVKHTGVLPLFKAFEAATSAMVQQNRGGASTIYTTWYHYEADLICQLKNTRGTYESRVRHMDQGIILNNYFIEKALNKEDVYLFHMNHARELYPIMGDYNKFKEVYERLCNEVPNKHKKKINAYKLLDMIVFERSFTGRIYLVNADNMYKGPWKEPVYNSNLCCEIQLPNTPLDGSRGTPEIASCILAGFNHGYIKDERVPVIAEYLVRFLDNMIDYMDYAIPEVEYSTTKRRALGIGHSDMFHFLAKSKKFYNTNEGRELIHKRVESCFYNLLLASNKIAQERGKCELFSDTKYSDGWLPFDEFENYKESNIKLEQDWETLRELIKKFGLRNSTLSATAPFGNSAKPSNSTSGVEPPRYLATMKDDKNFKLLQLVPEFKTCKNYYTTAWGDDFNNYDYFKMLGLIQKFTDQAISTNQYTNLFKYKDKMVPMKDALGEILTAFNCGLKTLYYQNFLSNDESDGVQESEEKSGCSGGACSV